MNTAPCCTENKSWLSSKVSHTLDELEVSPQFISTYYRFNETTYIMELFALCKIKPGEELTYSCKLLFNNQEDGG
jgi:hypothetical protein